MGANVSFDSLQFFGMDVFYPSDFVLKDVESAVHGYEDFVESFRDLYEILVVIRHITVLADIWLL